MRARSKAAQNWCTAASQFIVAPLLFTSVCCKPNPALSMAHTAQTQCFTSTLQSVHWEQRCYQQTITGQAGEASPSLTHCPSNNLSPEPQCPHPSSVPVLTPPIRLPAAAAWDGAGFISAVTTYPVRPILNPFATFR